MKKYFHQNKLNLYDFYSSFHFFYCFQNTIINNPQNCKIYDLDLNSIINNFKRLS